MKDRKEIRVVFDDTDTTYDSVKKDAGAEKRTLGKQVQYILSLHYNKKKLNKT